MFSEGKLNTLVQINPGDFPTVKIVLQVRPCSCMTALSHLIQVGDYDLFSAFNHTRVNSVVQNKRLDTLSHVYEISIILVWSLL